MKRREFLTAAAGIGLSAAWAGEPAAAAEDAAEKKTEQNTGHRRPSRS